eukprot:Nk52_evm45s239 gene=Nk52_evmTU45s239
MSDNECNKQDLKYGLENVISVADPQSAENTQKIKGGTVVTKIVTKEIVTLYMYIVFERATFYGFSLSMAQYLIDMLEVGDSLTNVIVQSALTALYVTPVVGGYLADSRYGRLKVGQWGCLFSLFAYGAIFASSLPFVWSNFPNMPGVWSELLFYLGLIGLAFGSIGKSPITAMFADQADSISDDPDAMEKIFFHYQMAVSIGPALSMYVIPLLFTFGEQKQRGTTHNGTSYYFSFGVCFGLYLLAALGYISQRKGYVNAGKPSESTPMNSIFRTIRNGYHNRRHAKKETFSADKEAGRPNNCAKRSRKSSLLDYCDEQYASNAQDLKDATHVIVMILVFSTAFCLLYQQIQSSIVVQANWIVTPSWMPPPAMAVFEAIFAVIGGILIVPFQKVFKLGPIARMTIGLILSAFSFLYLAGVQYFIDADGLYVGDVYESSISVWVQLPSFMFLGVATIFFLASTPEYAYAVSPKYMKTFILSMRNLSVAAGSLVSIPLSPLLVREYFFYTYLGLGIFVLLLGIAFHIIYRKCDKTYAEIIEKKNAEAKQTEQRANENGHSSE